MSESQIQGVVSMGRKMWVIWRKLKSACGPQHCFIVTRSVDQACDPSLHENREFFDRKQCAHVEPALFFLSGHSPAKSPEVFIRMNCHSRGIASLNIEANSRAFPARENVSSCHCQSHRI